MSPQRSGGSHASLNGSAGSQIVVFEISEAWDRSSEILTCPVYFVCSDCSYYYLPQLTKKEWPVSGSPESGHTTSTQKTFFFQKVQAAWKSGSLGSHVAVRQSLMTAPEAHG